MTKGKNVFDKAGDLLNRAVGDDGIKTSITVTLSRESYIKLGASIIVAGVTLMIVWYLFKMLNVSKQ